MDYLSSSRLSGDNNLIIEEEIEKDGSSYTFNLSASASEELFQGNEELSPLSPYKNNNFFNCVKCQKIFKEREEFDRHLPQHEEYRCNICDVRYKTVIALNRHLLCHKQNNKMVSFVKHKTFKCHSCDMEFNSENNYSLHLTIHNNGMYTCSTCYNGFKNKRGLISHLLIHFENKKHECPICKKRFRRVDLHSACHSDAKPYSCNQCDKSYKSKGALTNHMDKKHETKLICTQCDAVFKTRSELRAHTKYHTVSCHVCKKEFKTASVLKRHSIVHSEKRIYRCGICNETYKTDLTLTQHLLCHSDARNYVCPVCDKKFKTKTTCNVHMLVHMDKSLFPDKCKCPQCGKVFNSPRDVRKHVLSHESNKYFECELCDMTFRKTNTLLDHLRESHGFITPED